jgi:hypothetical protein
MHKTSKNFGAMTSIFFVVIMLIGNFMLLNLFLAIILKNVEDKYTT